jgi:hypothetical protein
MATVRKRTWQSGGETKQAWIADYFDQAGKRHQMAFKTKKAGGRLPRRRCMPIMPLSFVGARSKCHPRAKRVSGLLSPTLGAAHHIDMTAAAARAHQPVGAPIKHGGLDYRAAFSPGLGSTRC